MALGRRSGEARRAKLSPHCEGARQLSCSGCVVTWFRTDDDFPSIVKVDALEAAAGSWQVYAAAAPSGMTSAATAPGDAPTGSFTASAPTASAAPLRRSWIRPWRLFVASGLIRADGSDAYRFHDWDDYQPTKAELDHEKRLSADRRRRGACGSRRHARRTVTPLLTALRTL